MVERSTYPKAIIAYWGQPQAEYESTNSTSISHHKCAALFTSKSTIACKLAKVDEQLCSSLIDSVHQEQGLVVVSLSMVHEPCKEDFDSVLG